LSDTLLIFGFGYSGHAIAKAAVAAGFAVTATSRDPAALPPAPGVDIIPFDAASAAIAAATHILATAAPDEQGDPVLHRYRAEITAAPDLRWIGYLSTTGVYGNRDGGWVDEDTPPAPQSPRAQRRVDAEAAWGTFAKNAVIASEAKQSISTAPPNKEDGLLRSARNDDGCAVDIFRLAGIYGPGRSMFDDLRAGAGRRVIKPGHLFGRIHRDDIAHGVLAALTQNPPPGVRKFNFSDDEPAASADVVVEAARLLGVDPPPAVPFDQAAPAMSPMGLSFWAENRRVANAKTKAALGIKWLYPSYREGLRAILVEETH
jgi:nucleoside-diphosphate-sugar epimerase